MTFHVLVATIVPFCLFAGWWQVNRALSGNLLSYAYSVEWPAFAVIAIIGWWQLIHEDPAEVVARKEERARRAGRLRPAPVAAGGDGLAGEAAGNALAGEAGGDGPGGNGLGAAAGGNQSVPGPGASVSGSEEVASEAPVTDDAPVDALTAYNAYLRRLAEGGQRKTWRNPRGLPS